MEVRPGLYHHELVPGRNGGQQDVGGFVTGEGGADHHHVSHLAVRKGWGAGKEPVPELAVNAFDSVLFDYIDGQLQPEPGMLEALHLCAKEQARKGDGKSFFVASLTKKKCQNAMVPQVKATCTNRKGKGGV